MDPHLWLADMDLQGYLAAFAPLAAAMLAVPTLEEARQGFLSWPRPVLLEPAELRRSHHHLSLTEASLREGRWWTLVSYMFLHQDEGHMAGNLLSVFASGRDVYRTAGTLGLYTVFLVSGAAAGANRWGRLRQLEAQLAGAAPRLPKSISDWVPEGVQSWVDIGIARVAKSSAPLLTELSSDLGASGGACGVMGFSLGLALERLLDSWGFWPRGGSATAPTGQRTGGSLFAVLVALDCTHFLVREWRLCCGSDGLTGVGHACHLTGFATGLGLLVAWRLLAGLRNGPPPLASGGQRLGGRRHVDATGELH